MKSISYCILTVIVLSFMNLSCKVDSAFTVTELKCENLASPNGIDNTTPRFSWKVRCKQPMQQLYYQIQVASDSLLLEKGEADLWDTSKTESSASVMVPYQGQALQSRQLCYWRVCVWNEKGDSVQSSIHRFAIGIVEDDMLRGDYIGLSAEGGDVRSPLLRKAFTVDDLGTAFLHVNSLGYHEVYINGVKVGENVLSPATSQLPKRSLIVTYDVSRYLQKGQNELVVWLGQGWYKKTTFGTDYDGPLVKAEMNIMEKGVWKPILSTDTSWTGRESGYSDMGTWRALQFGGERIDRRILPDNLSADVLNQLQWFPVTSIAVSPEQGASPQMCEMDKIQEVLMPKDIKQVGDSTWLIDMGKVMVGWFEIELPQLPEGYEVVVKYSDNLTKDGTFDEEQGERDLYIASGKPHDVFCNKFHYHAFRYVQIMNLPEKPEASRIKGHRIYSDYKSAGTFECSDADLNAIHDMIHYTFTCLTFGGYMVDCPHLERAGYGGDGNSSTIALQTMYDVAPTFYNWLQTWEDVMREGGSLPHVAPNPGAGGGGPYWCGIIVLAPWRTYVNYDDSRLIERHYDAMKRWFEYVDAYTVDGLLKRWPDTPHRDWYLGDWLAPSGVDSGNQSSIDLVSNCLISECLGIMEKIAVILGEAEEARMFSERRAKLNQLLHDTYYNAEEGIYATGSQLDMSYAMLTGVVPEALYDKVKEKMIMRTSSHYNDHIAVGLVGVPILTEWVIKNREVDFMYSMLKKQDYPGYLHMINNNATATWEYWSGERSRVHNCYNGIGAWFYQAVGGIQPDENNPGYRHIYIEPQIPQGVTWAKTTKETPYGTVVVNWELKGKRMVMHVSLPVGTQANVAVPDKATGCTINGKKTTIESQYLPLQTGTFDMEFALGS